MENSQIESLIQAHISESTVQVLGEDGVHFQVIVVSDAFEGVTRVKRQQMVYAAVNEHILDGSLHAMALKTYTTTEWAKQAT